MQTRQFATFAAGALGTLALVVACGALPVVGADDSDDPSPLFVVEAECDKVQEYDMGDVDHVQEFYAEAPIPEGARPIAALGCDRLCGDKPCEYRACTRESCEGYTPPNRDCVPLDFYVSGTQIIVSCGERRTKIQLPHAGAFSLTNGGRSERVTVTFVR